MSAGRPAVMIVLPYAMMARNLIDGGVLEHLARASLEATVVSPREADAAAVQRLGMHWRPLFHPRRARANALRRAGWSARYLAGSALRMALTYRFNVRRGFRGFAMRLRHSWRLRLRFLAEGLPMSALFGFPFPRSDGLYAGLYAFYYSRWQRFAPVEALFDEIRPRMLVLGHLQNPLATPYVLAARARGIAILGINGSWDQPTTKGPLCPGLQRVLVQNEQVKSELVAHHAVPAERIDVVGWPQMDPYASVARRPREEFARAAGYRADERYVVFGANTGRLGEGEPEIAAGLAERIRAGRFGPALRLHLRCHPNDTQWRERFGSLLDHPAVRVEPPSGGALGDLADLLHHAEAVIASAGSICLDAVALDTPAIGLAWEALPLPYEDRPARAYELEHLAALAHDEGVPLARNFEELEALVTETLGDRARRSASRQALRRRFVEPLDGGAGRRIAGHIAAMASA